MVISSNSPNITKVLHEKLYGRFIETNSNIKKGKQLHRKRKELHRKNQGSNFLGDSFSNRDDIRAPIQLRGVRQSQYIKTLFFSRPDPSINSSNKKTTSGPSQNYLAVQIQLQKQTLAAATNQKPNFS